MDYLDGTNLRLPENLKPKRRGRPAMTEEQKRSVCKSVYITHEDEEALQARMSGKEFQIQFYEWFKNLIK